MQIRPGDLPSEFRLFKGDRQIGYIKNVAVGFGGFGTETEAAQAAYTAHRALGRRRSQAAELSIPNAPEELLLGEHGGGQYVIARSGLLARLVPPDPDYGYEGWGFEISLRPEEHATVFAMSRARTIWQALRGCGWLRRMRQFSKDATAYQEVP